MHICVVILMFLGFLIVFLLNRGSKLHSFVFVYSHFYISFIGQIQISNISLQGLENKERESGSDGS